MVKKKLRGKIDRIKSGIRGLDDIIGGGFVKNSAILVRGDTGTAKTLFSLNFLYNGAKRYNEPGIFITLSETEESIMRYGNMFKWDMDQLVDKNMLSVLHLAPHDLSHMVGVGGGSFTDTIESIGAKRLVIDSLTAYKLIFENEYKSITSLHSLFELMRNNKVTSLVTSEFPVTPESNTRERLGYMADTIINLYSVRDRTRKYRALEVFKMRHTNHDNKINRFSIDNNGMKIHPKRRGKS
jgi:circadian clock protein KaiC